MSATPIYLPGQQPRARWMRLETVQLLKRFFFCERALIISQSSWLPVISPIEVKLELPRFIWQNALTADALRNRILELRYPNRILEEEGTDRPLSRLFATVREAPSLSAFLLSAASVLLPTLRDAYRRYLELADQIADAPSARFLDLAVREKEEQIRLLVRWAEIESKQEGAGRNEAVEWTQALANSLSSLGGLNCDSATVGRAGLPQSGKPYTVPDRPSRDSRFWLCRFYWPDIVDSSYPYGEGIGLQLRSAISHFNEVWAVETGGLVLSAFSEMLPWEWIHDAARWTYDEARHCEMGYNRLRSWGFEPSEIPLGSYIYESAAGQDPIYRLGLLYFFETKNIQHKQKRARLFHDYKDSVSEHDIDFDWADETIHTSYGKQWLMRLLAASNEDPSMYDAIRERCQQLVERCVETASAQEVAAIKQLARALIDKAHGKVHQLSSEPQKSPAVPPR
jgi:hypothetical protein